MRIKVLGSEAVVEHPQQTVQTLAVQLCKISELWWNR